MCPTSYLKFMRNCYAEENLRHGIGQAGTHCRGARLGLFDALKGKGKIGGEIAFFGLEDWWLGEFTDADRMCVLAQYQPTGSSDYNLAKGQIWESSQSVVAFLGILAGWFNKDENRHIAKLIVRKAESLVNDATEVLDVHFLYQTKIECYYRDRDNNDSLDVAIRACQQQINIAPQAAGAFKKEHGDWLPNHKGFTQLAIILEKRKGFAEAIALCENALEHGWGGDWEKRIERCRRKADKP